MLHIYDKYRHPTKLLVQVRSVEPGSLALVQAHYGKLWKSATTLRVGHIDGQRAAHAYFMANQERCDAVYLFYRDFISDKLYRSNLNSTDAVWPFHYMAVGIARQHVLHT